jgi:F0F1-type ATP synthase assembly protein I
MAEAPPAPPHAPPPDPASKPEAEPEGGWRDWTGVGFEFAAAVVLFFLLGAWLDATWGTLSWMRLAGAGLGVVVGTYLLIKKALGIDRPARSSPASRPKDPPAP